jgi:hypothetical protein
MACRGVCADSVPSRAFPEIELKLRFLFNFIALVQTYPASVAARIADSYNRAMLLPNVPSFVKVPNLMASFLREVCRRHNSWACPKEY